MNSEIGIVYLDIEEFEEGDTIHMLFDAIYGVMNKILYYEFNDEEPTDINKTFAHSMKSTNTVTSQEETETGERETVSYYYDIEKEENKKYLVMKYTDFRGEYLQVENNKANWGLVLSISVTSLIILIFIIVIGRFVFVKIRKYKNAAIYDQNQSQPTGTLY